VTAKHPGFVQQRTLSVAAFWLLIGLMTLSIAWELWLAPLRPGGSWLVIKAFPLLLPLSGIVSARRYTYQWSSMLILLYVLEGSVRLLSDSPPSRWLAAIELALSLAYFTVVVAYVRLDRRTTRVQGDHQH
jgi:uncharacterized membrane protein